MQALFAIFNPQGYLNDVVKSKAEAEDIILNMADGSGYICYMDWDWIPNRLQPGWRHHMIINRLPRNVKPRAYASDY